MEEDRIDFPFPNTRWTMVARAGEGDSRVVETALAELCEIYWRPVYAFVRSKGNSPEDAEDLTQSFFARILAREDIAAADASKGKFRSYLLASAKNFMISEWQKGQAQKRGGGRVIESLDIDEAETGFRQHEPSDGITPEKQYERQWALTLMQHAREKLAQRYTEDGKIELFKKLEPLLVPGGSLPPYAELAEPLGMTESSLGVAAHRLRQRYGSVLRETVADTLGPEDDLEEELGHLLGAFS